MVFADPRLDPYKGSTNIERIRALSGRRPVSAARKTPGLTIAVLNLDRPDLIVHLIEKAAAFQGALADDGLGFQLLIGDTGSTDPLVLEAYTRLPSCVQVVSGMQYHFSRANNDLCDRRVLHDHLLLLNNDVHLRDPQVLHHLLGLFQDPRVGVVGLVLDFPDGQLQHAGLDFIRVGPLMGLPEARGNHRAFSHEVGRHWRAISVTGAALMVRTELWEKVGGLDEGFLRECQDVDFCLRVQRLGYDIRVVDAGPVVHEENGTRTPGEEHWPDRALLNRRWLTYLQAVYQ